MHYTISVYQAESTKSYFLKKQASNPKTRSVCVLILFVRLFHSVTLQVLNRHVVVRLPRTLQAREHVVLLWLTLRLSYTLTDDTSKAKIHYEGAGIVESAHALLVN